MMEGLAKHNGPVTAPHWAMAAVDAGYPLDLTSHASLEAQVAALADDIAYDNHDIDDGLRAGLIEFDDLLSLPMVRVIWDDITARFAGVDPKRLRSELVRHQIGLMVTDVIATTRAAIAASGVETVDDVRAAGRALATFSPAMAEREAALKRFMYANLYHHPKQLDVAEAARGLVSALFSAYCNDPRALPDYWRETLPATEPDRARHIADFIAGMTDRYAINCYRAIIGPIDLPDAF
jgi:dGTPase